MAHTGTGGWAHMVFYKSVYFTCKAGFLNGTHTWQRLCRAAEQLRPGVCAQICLSLHHSPLPLPSSLHPQLPVPTARGVVHWFTRAPGTLPQDTANTLHPLQTAPTTESASHPDASFCTKWKPFNHVGSTTPSSLNKCPCEVLLTSAFPFSGPDYIPSGVYLLSLG